MQVEIKQVPVHHVAYVRRVGPYGPGVREAWDRLRLWAGPRGLFPEGTPMFGVGHDDPTITPPDKCRYDACIPVPPEVKPEREIGIADIPGGTAAVVRYEGPPDRIMAAYKALYGEWLPKSGYQPADAPCYEIYQGDPQVRPGHLAFDIVMLVKPL